MPKAEKSSEEKVKLLTVDSFMSDIIENEVVEAMPTLGAGVYTAALGKIYRGQTKKGNPALYVDFLLLQYKPEGQEEGQGFSLMKGTRLPSNEIDLSVLRDGAGNAQVFGLVKKVTFEDAQEGTPAWKVNATANQKRHLAAGLRALHTDNKTILWDVIKNRIGTLVNFQMVLSKDKKWTNIDLPTMFLLEEQKVGLNSMMKVYEEIKTVMEEFKSRKSAGGDSEGYSASHDKDDLPF